MGIFATVGKAISASFGALGGDRSTSNTKPAGGDGAQAYGGFLDSPERSAALIGQRKYLTYGNAVNTAIVATGLRRTLDMLAGTEWHAEENPAGGKDAKRGVGLVTKGLIEAQMPSPWSAIVRKQALYRYYGFALHAWTIKRDTEGNQVFAEIAHRPQYTIDRWDKPSDQYPWLAVGQLTNQGNRYTIDRRRLFYAVDDSITDSPEGTGLLRHVVELIRRLGVLEGLEILAYETDLRGMPIGRVPLAEMKNAATASGANTKDQIEAFIAERTQVIRNSLAGIIKDPSRLQHLLLESAPYLGADQDTFSTIRKWEFELLKGQSNGVDHVAAAIGRIQLEIARVLGIEFALVGGNSSAGTYGMHTDKTRFFAQNLRTMLREIAAFATRDLARTLVALNGLDPDTATPTLVASPVSTEAVREACEALQLIAQAGLQPDDPVINVLRGRMELPDAPEPTPEMLGMQLGRIGGGQAPRPGPPDPAAGEVDVQVDDLGAQRGSAGGKTKPVAPAKPATPAKRAAPPAR